jgi:uncharacterized protein
MKKINLTLEQKYNNLRSLFSAMEKVLVAYSGGVDSTLLLRVGHEVLGENCIAVLGISASLASDEYKEALDYANSFDAKILTLETNEFDNDAYLKNDDRRCFYCKHELFTGIKDLAAEMDISYILDGSNADDIRDYRPGLQAAQSLTVRSPLMEVGLNKEEIRELAKFLGLPNWNKPAQPCLASRVAYGQNIDENLLGKIAQAEKVLRTKEFKIVRVRYMGGYVSVEVGKDEVDRLMSNNIKNQVVKEFQEIGFLDVRFDENGYESGKLNKKLA